MSFYNFGAAYRLKSVVTKSVIPTGLEDEKLTNQFVFVRARAQRCIIVWKAISTVGTADIVTTEFIPLRVFQQKRLIYFPDNNSCLGMVF